MILEPNGTPAETYAPGAAQAAQGARGSYVEWSAILGGTVLASAISMVMLQFGGGIGLAAVSPYDAGRELTIGGLLAIGAWLLWVQVTTSMVGGYIAGRMRAPVVALHSHETEVRDGIHGVLVWATSTVFVALAVTLMGAIGQSHAATAASATLTDAQRHTTIIFSFGAAASSLVSGVAAWWAATMGGDHRDSGIDHSRHFSFKKR